MRNSSGAQKFVRIFIKQNSIIFCLETLALELMFNAHHILDFTFIESNFLQPSVAVSNIGKPNISL